MEEKNKMNGGSMNKKQKQTWKQSQKRSQTELEKLENFD